MEKLLFHFAALFLLLVFSGCEKNPISFNADSPTGKKIKLEINLKPGDIKFLNLEVETNSTIKAKGKKVEMKVYVLSEMSLEVLEVSEIGVHLVKAKYEKLAINIDGPMKMNFDSSDAFDLESPMGKIMGSVIGKSFTVKLSRKGKNLGFQLDPSINPIVRQQIEKSMQSFTLGTSFPELAIDNGDTWQSEFGQKQDGIEISYNSENTLLKQKEGLAVIGISSELQGSGTGKSHGLINIDINSGWIDTGKLTSDFIIEKGDQEIETKMVMKLTGGNLNRKVEKKKMSPVLKEQDFKILQTSGIFRKNPKGKFIFAENNGKKYFVSNKMVKDKVGDMTDQRVQINARFRTSKETGAPFLTFIKSVNSLED